MEFKHPLFWANYVLIGKDYLVLKPNIIHTDIVINTMISYDITTEIKKIPSPWDKTIVCKGNEMFTILLNLQKIFDAALLEAILENK